LCSIRLPPPESALQPVETPRDDVIGAPGDDHLGDAAVAGRFEAAGRGGVVSAGQFIGQLVQGKIHDPFERTLPDHPLHRLSPDAVRWKATTS